MRDGIFELGHEIKVLSLNIGNRKTVIRNPSNLKRS